MGVCYNAWVATPEINTPWYFGIPDFDAEIQKAQDDVFRDLRIKFWPTISHGMHVMACLMVIMQMVQS